MFNDEKLAYAVYASEIPVISAVGHETDFTICDFAADLRAPTPSAAAELAVPDAAEVRANVYALQNRLQRSVSSLLQNRRYAYTALTERGVLQNPSLYFDALRMRTADLYRRFEALQTGLLQKERLRLSENAAKLQSLSPLAVLARGYAVASRADGSVVRSANALQSGETLKLRFADGTASCVLNEIS